MILINKIDETLLGKIEGCYLALIGTGRFGIYKRG
jgi:hypothetical protein